MKIATLKIAFFLLAISFTNCSKEEDPVAPLQQLPPMTQVGANTVGCLVNGEVFLPHQKNPTGVSSTICFYQFVNNKWNFSLGFSNDKQTKLRAVNIATKNHVLEQGKTYELISGNGNSLFGNYTIYNGGISNIDKYVTNGNSIKGELTIKYLNKQKNIISGTFWFNAVNTNDEKIEIRDGRFDMQYSQ
ncbi:conserved exported protein of unknown function [Tenacibaculum sp. 190524A02b]|uniref:DUF6252 family protein n=1 Tax=Tenacibaculum vairaonense TaxID=3137860 RepID=UPI0032B12D34